MSESAEIYGGVTGGMAVVRLGSRSRAWAYFELTKPRIGALVLVATAAGFFLALPAGASLFALVTLVGTLFGVGLVASGANALNQYLEAEYDAQMTRTSGRPLPTGRLSGGEVLGFGVMAGAAGVLWLALAVNPLAAQWAAITLLLYVCVYTPLKRRTSLCVFAGAVPGALPPVIGWAGAAGHLTPDAWSLFAIMFFWQLPHFAAIAWLYREDYARAGYPMLPVVDPQGQRTDLHMITHSVGLLMASLVPALSGATGAIYAVGAMALGTAFLACGVIFARHKTIAAARFHLLASISYLPALCGLLVADRLHRLMTS